MDAESATGPRERPVGDTPSVGKGPCMDAEQQRDEPHRVRTHLVACPHCKREVDVSKPVPVDGWHVLRRCRGGGVEVQALGAGEHPWAWRTVKAQAGGA